MTQNHPIGVFDSGLGGLTAVRELRRILPGEDIVYFGDTGRVPYGTRGREVIIRYAKQDIAFLLSQNVKTILAACGTVSSTLPPAETKDLPVGYTGVVSAAAKAAIAATRNGRVGIIGTAATVASGSYQSTLRALSPTVHSVANACPLFVPLVENGHFAKGDALAALATAEYLAPMREARVDTLILGCTHYPLLHDAIRDYMGGDVALVDSGSAAAGALAESLRTQNLLSGKKEGGSVRYFVSDDTARFDELARLFLGGYAGGEVRRVNMEDYPCGQV